ncbi:probable bifunctional dTTP/UTP pyrophosphatase/methyltransferase protein isoform X2 [Callorhinchus milii]|nr:probable bifunctional dTTP/UTP pyrophosphatase/methyltransferase protein isoform X2 [Callorhinchus milii]
MLNPVMSKLVGKRVVLASASPRRREILNNVGLRFEIVPSWFKETLDKSAFEMPYEYAKETAKEKALEVAKRMHLKHLKTPDIVIGADTVVSIDNDILEKPIDKKDAYRMLSRLVSALCLLLKCFILGTFNFKPVLMLLTPMFGTI